MSPSQERAEERQMTATAKVTRNEDDSFPTHIAYVPAISLTIDDVQDLAVNGAMTMTGSETFLLCITDEIEQGYTDPDSLGELTWQGGSGAEMVPFAVTIADIVDTDDDSVEGHISGPVADDWLPDVWDEAIIDAGWVRVAGWDLASSPNPCTWIRYAESSA